MLMSFFAHLKFVHILSRIASLNPSLPKTWLVYIQVVASLKTLKVAKKVENGKYVRKTRKLAQRLSKQFRKTGKLAKKKRGKNA